MKKFRRKIKIFILIISNLQRSKLLNIIKYNKVFQRKLNIDINDYKDYCEIEIEIIPANYEYGKFINIFDKKDKNYFHIYFNNNNIKKEIKRTYRQPILYSIN